MVRRNRASRRAAFCALAIALIAGCAPDAVTNRAATGFNEYLAQVAVACKPLMLGRYDMSYRMQQMDMYDDDYNYFLDLTSRLFYQAVTPAAYKSGINGFFGGGATTDRSINCIIGNLPADRPKSGPTLIKVN